MKKSEVLATDKEKLLIFSESLTTALIRKGHVIKYPDVTSDEAITIMENVYRMFEDIQKYYR